MASFGETLKNLFDQTAFLNLTVGNYVMILVACLLLFLAIKKGFEPLLLIPIAFGMLLVNIYPSIMAPSSTNYVNAEGKTVAMVEYDGENLEAAINASQVKLEGNEVTYYYNDAQGDEVEVATVTLSDGYTQADFEALLADKSYTTSENAAGLLYYFYKMDEWAILPSLIFMGVGAMTDFGPLIANPISFLMGAAAQLGIYVAYFLAMAFGFNGKASAAISIIGGADGPTSIFLASKLGQTGIMGAIAVAAYSYMSLVPMIQPPIMKAFTTKKEKLIKMGQLRPVSKLERILFPVIITIVVCMILPSTAPLVGMLMLGNLFRESGVVRQLTDTASNALMYIVVIILGTSVGATTSAEKFLNKGTLIIVACGLVAFAFGTFGGVMLGKLLSKITHGKINPLIGSAGVSAVPMAARVSQKVGAEYDPTNFLLMHAMGPNVAGVIGTAVAAGTFMAIFGVR